MGTGMGIYLVVAVGVILLIWLFFYFVPLGLWFSAVFARVYVPVWQLIAMRIRKVPPSIILNNLVSATKAGLKLNAD